MFTSAADAYMKVFGQTFTGVAGNPLDGIKPVVYSLASAYPNPLKDRSNIKFGLPRSSHVEIEVYNIAGQRIKTLVNANLEAGYHSVYWNGRNDAGQRVANGVYVYRMNSGSFQATKKLLILK